MEKLKLLQVDLKKTYDSLKKKYLCMVENSSL